jgi:hypothetical protein
MCDTKNVHPLAGTDVNGNIAKLDNAKALELAEVAKGLKLWVQVFIPVDDHSAVYVNNGMALAEHNADRAGKRLDEYVCDTICVCL